MLIGIALALFSLLYISVSVHGHKAQSPFSISRISGNVNTFKKFIGGANLNPTFDAYDAGLFAPLEDLNLLSTTEFTSLTHPLFLNHGVRIKKSKFCDGNVSAYTGYIDVEARHLFFYFFESRKDPDHDDVIFWTTGGPGGSSSLGLFMELGPCRVVSDNATRYNPYAWNEHANVFFVDQPIGVGFSYAEHEESVSTSQEAGKDIAAFVAIFFEHFSKFKGRPFHMAGESYGGTYVPTFAAEVYDQNAKLLKAGLVPINLTSIMLGNGCTEQLTMVPSYYDMQCLNTTVRPVTDIASCVRMKQIVPRCQRWIKESCVDTFDRINCEAAESFCTEILYESLYTSSDINPYDLTRRCDGSYLETLCYPIFEQIASYLNASNIRKEIGVDPSWTGNFSYHSWEVNGAFSESLDIEFPTQFYITALLERGIKTLVYVGATDFVCNWIGNERMTLALEWTGHHDFSRLPLRDWKVGGEVAGLTRNFGPLTFATISDAGHMVPYDQPERSLELTRRWLAGEEL